MKLSLPVTFVLGVLVQLGTSLDPALHQPELAPDPAQHRGDHQHHDQEQVVEQHQGHGEPNVEGLSGFQDGEEVAGAVCRTTANEACVFPFTFAGKTYKGCTNADSNRLWCYTETDLGECSESCPTHDEFLQTTCVTKDNRICQFPFVDSGKVHYTCAPKDKKHKSSWCATAVTDRNAIASQEFTGLCSSACKERTWFTSVKTGTIWSFNCDFIGNDLDRVPLRADPCIRECEKEPDCSHFTWNPARGGICHLKTGSAVSKDSVVPKRGSGVKCGIVQSISPIEWEENNLAYSCNFFGTEFETLKVTSEECIDACTVSIICTHFTWSETNGGTCLMFDGDVTKNDAFYVDDPTMMCGIVELE